MRVEIAPEPLWKTPGDASEAAARGKKKERKEDSGLLIYTNNGPRAASEVLRRSRALLKRLSRRLGPLPRGLGEAPGTSRGALGSVFGSSESVSETILDGFWSSEEPA